MYKNLVRAVAIVFLLSTQTLAAPKSFTLKKNFYQSVRINSKSMLCGYVSKKWQAIEKVGSRYRLKAKATSSHKSACNALLRKGTFSSLAKLPSVSKIVQSSAHSASKVGALDVSGTPPALTDISSIGVTNLFWRSGVFDGYQSGTPSEEQCNEFWIGQTDGTSGGLLSCTMTEDVGYAFEPVLRSATSLCYMKNFPTPEVQNSGAIDVVSGTLPDGGISKLFSVPEGNSPRIVKVRTLGGEQSQTIFIKVYPSSANESAGYQYRVKLWFCGKPSDSAPVAVLNTEDIAVTLSGMLNSSSVGLDQYGRYSAAVTGALKLEDSSIDYDETRDRTALVRYRSVSDGNRFKASMNIGANGIITQKFYNTYGGGTSKRYTLSRVGGDTLQNLRFYEGAFTDISIANGSQTSETHSGATEYRDEGYRSAPDSALLSKVNQVSIADDAFFDALGDVGSTDPDLSCTTDATIELTLDMSADAMQAVRTTCEANNEQTNNFCRENDSIKEVMQNFQSLCNQTPH